MERPIITVAGKEHEMRELKGRDWRLLGEFLDNASTFTDTDFLEKHAGFIAEFYDGVTVEDIFDLPLEDIMPVSRAVQNYIVSRLGLKLQKIEKNSETGKEQ